MQGIPLEERKRLGALLDTRPQTEVMAMISQFSQAETLTILLRRPHRFKGLGRPDVQYGAGRQPAGNSGISPGLPGYSAF